MILLPLRKHQLEKKINSHHANYSHVILIAHTRVNITINNSSIFLRVNFIKVFFSIDMKLNKTLTNEETFYISDKLLALRKK